MKKSGIMIKRSKQRIFHLLALMLVMAFGVSCTDDYFDVPVGERITADEHYNTAIDAEVSVYGTLIALQSAMPGMIMVDGLRTDQMDVTDMADADLRAINEHNISPGNAYIDPSAYYKVIVNVNEVLDHIDRIYEKDRNYESIILREHKGSLIGLRAWAYLNLVRLYGQVAWIDDKLDALPKGGEQMMMTKDILIDSLIDQIVPYVYNTEEGEDLLQYPLLGFIDNKVVLGELYLEKNDYENAALYLKMALRNYNSVPDIAEKFYKVDKTYESESWMTMFFGAENASAENIFTIPYNSTQGQNNPLAMWMLPSDQYMVKPSKVLMDSMERQIQSNGSIGDLYRGMGITYDTTSTGEPYIKKYAIDEAEPYSSDIVLVRAAEVHLLLAEALNRAGESNTALVLLNNGINGESGSNRPAGFASFSANRGVRGRVLLKAREVSDTIPEMERIERIEDLIIEEKAMECAFEGKRMADLMRVAERRDNPGEYLSSKIAAKFSDPAKAALIKSKLMDKSNWFLPWE